MLCSMGGIYGGRNEHETSTLKEKKPILNTKVDK